MAALATQIATLLALVAVGWALRAGGIVAREDARGINAVIVYAGLPALVFTAVRGARLEARLLEIAAVAWVAFGVTLLAAWLLGRALRLPADVRGAFMLASSLGNTGYIGYPVTRSLFGEEGLVRAVVYDVLGTVLALALVGVPFARRHGSSGAHHRGVLRELFSFPAVPALILALATKPLLIPVPVSAGLDMLAKMTTPLIMIAVGITLQPATIRRFAVPLAGVAGLKLVVSPLVALAVGAVVLRDAQTLRIAVLEAGMPTMMLTLVVGDRFGLDTDFGASAILVTTVGFIATMPLLQLIA